MNLEDATELFQSKGLFIKETHPSYGKGILIAGEIDKSDKIWVLNEVTLIYSQGDQWVFDTQTGVPLPIADDVIHEVASLDDAVRISLNRYFGQPCILQNWVFPIQKHPEWDLELINLSLTNAESISSERWSVLKQQYEKRFHGLFTRDNRGQWITLWKEHPEFDFRKLEYVTASRKELCMSRDTKKMYMIEPILGE